MTHIDINPSLYRAGVGIALINAHGHVFVGKRRDQGEAPAHGWQMPQGGIDDHEHPETALWRELEEEVGTTNATLLGQTRDWIYYDMPADLRTKIWGGAYIGQRQKWFALRFTGDDRDIRLDKHATPEFSDWRWADPATLVDMIVPFKRDLYQRVLQELSPFFQPT